MKHGCPITYDDVDEIQIAFKQREEMRQRIAELEAELRDLRKFEPQ